jgi:hypothetical protein
VSKESVHRALLVSKRESRYLRAPAMPFRKVALGSAEFDVLGYFGSVVEQRDTASVAKVTILKVSKGSRERPILIGSNLARVEDALQRREPSDVKHSA